MGRFNKHPDGEGYDRPKTHQQRCTVVYHKELQYRKGWYDKGILYAGEVSLCCERYHAVRYTPPSPHPTATQISRISRYTDSC